MFDVVKICFLMNITLILTNCGMKHPCNNAAQEGEIIRTGAILALRLSL